MRIILAVCVCFLMMSVPDELALAQPGQGSGVDSTVTIRQKNQQVIAASLAILGTAFDASQWGKTYRSLCFFGAGHLLQEDWLTGAGFLAGEASLLVLRNNLVREAGTLDRLQYPYISNDLEFQREGRSPSSYANLINASSTDLLLGDLNWVDMYTAFRIAHDKSSAINKVNFHDDGVA